MKKLYLLLFLFLLQTFCLAQPIKIYFTDGTKKEGYFVDAQVGKVKYRNSSGDIEFAKIEDIERMYKKNNGIYKKVNIKKLFKYNYYSEKRVPANSFLMAAIVPTAGHFNAGNWGRGGMFLLAEIVIPSLFFVSGANSDNGIGLIITGYISLSVLKIWECFDAFFETEKRNENVKEE